MHGKDSKDFNKFLSATSILNPMLQRTERKKENGRIKEK
jgi:hypothetical protein